MEEDAVSERLERKGSKAVVRNSGNSFFQGLEEEDDLVRREERDQKIKYCLAMTRSGLAS